MTPLEQRRCYLGALARTLKAPDEDAALRELLPDWMASANGVRFASRSSRRRREYFAHRLFPRLFSRALDPAQRERLHLAYLGAFGGSAPDWSLNAERVVAVIAELVAATELPAAALDAAQHEWALFEAQRRSLVGVPAPSSYRYSVNPTLDARLYETDVATWAGREMDGLPLQRSAGSDPSPVGYFLHPTTLRARWRRLDATVLALLAMVDQQLSTASAAGVSGADANGIQRGLDALVEEGLLL